MDRLESMSILLTVVATGSLSAAGRQLRMPLPTVSRRISDLESHLKARLLIRSTRKLQLTEAGESYVVACRRILDEVAESERRASGEYRAPQGNLVLTAPLVFGRLHVLPVIADFLAAYPAVDIRAVLGDRRLDLLDEHLDLAIRIGTLPDSALIAIKVGEVRSVVCASPAYIKRRGLPMTPAALAAHDCVSFATHDAFDLWAFRGGETVRVHPRFAVNTAEAALDAAIAGVGFTRLLSYQVADAVKAGKLTRVLKPFETDHVPVNLVYKHATPITAKLRTFIDFAAPRLRAALAGKTPRPG